MSNKPKHNMQTQIFLQSLLKIEPPKNLREKVITDYSNIGDIIKIKQRMQSIRDLTNVLQRQNQLKKETKTLKKEKIKQELINKRNQSGNYPNIKGIEREASSPEQRKYSMFDEESSSLSEDFDDAMVENDKFIHNGKFVYPKCLSSIILRLSDILLNPDVVNNLNEQYKLEIIRLIQLCLQEQKCLIYKMPFFALHFLTNNSFTNFYSRLDFLKMITKNGRTMNEAFNEKMFLVLMNMIDPEKVKSDNQQINNQLQILEFLRNLFNYNPSCFSKAQTLILLTRICLVGFPAMHRRTDISFLVLEIFQYVMKYNNQSSTHNLKNLTLLALTIMVTKDDLTMITWPIIRKLIEFDPDRMVYEILEILMIGNNKASNKQRRRRSFTMVQGSSETTDTSKVEGLDDTIGDKTTNVSEIPGLQQSQAKITPNTDEEINDLQIMRELYIKCFNQKRDEFKLELEELENSVLNFHQSCLINVFEEIDMNLTIDELVCKMECPAFFIDSKQSKQIIDFDTKHKRVIQDKKMDYLLNRFEQDRHEFIEALEKHIDRVKRGAVYFLGMTLYGTDNIKECSYSISRILDIFRQVLTNTNNFKLINEIIQSILTLLSNKQIELSFEWDSIMDIIDTLFKEHAKLLISNKKLGDIDLIFKKATDLILLDCYPRDETRVYKLYTQTRTKYMSSKAFQDFEVQNQQHQTSEQALKSREKLAIPVPNFNLISLYIDHILNYDFENLNYILHVLFLNEANIQTKMLFLDKVQNFYKQSIGMKQQKEALEIMMVKTSEIVLKNKMNSSEIVYTDSLHAQEKKKKEAASPQLTQSSTIQNQNSRIQLKALDILSLISSNCTDIQLFEHIIKIIGNTLESQNLWKHPSLFMSSTSQTVKFKTQGSYSTLFKEMNAFQSLALKRLIQVFKLKLLTVESQKSATIFNCLLEIFKHDTLVKRRIIFDEIIVNLVINSQGDLCWMTKDFPLMFGIREFYRINQCKQCNLDSEQGENDEAISAGSHKMVVSIQALIEALNYQQVLGNEQVLQFKLNCLLKIKSLLMDIYIAEDNLHQVRSLDVKNHFPLAISIDQTRIYTQLVSNIEIKHNFECSKAIFEIVHIMISSQSQAFCQKSLLSISLESRRDLVYRINQNIRNAYLMITPPETNNMENRQTMHHSLNNSEYFKDEAPSEISKSVKNLNKTMIVAEDYTQMQVQILKQKEENKRFLLNLLHLLSLVLQSDCKFAINQQISSEDDQESPFRSIILNLFMICKSDSFLNDVSHHVVRVIESLIQLMQEDLFDDKVSHELLFLLLIRLSLPKIINIPSDFESFYTRAQQKQRGQFLKNLLSINFNPVNPQIDIHSCPEEPQFTVMLNKVQSLITNLFDICCCIEMFEVLQQFLSKTIRQFEWYYSETDARFKNLNSVQFNFTKNLVDLINWTFNTKIGRLKRHLNFGNIHDLQKSVFYIFNQNIIQIQEDPSVKNKFAINVRNASFNYQGTLEIHNPQQHQEMLPAAATKKAMKNGNAQVAISNNQDIDQMILLQCLHPIIVNQMRSEKTFVKLGPEHLADCYELSEELDNIPPYNVHIVFVCGYFCERETSFDFLSRLGNYTQLSLFQHYFKHLPSNSIKALERMNGVVFEEDLNDISIYVSDMFCVEPNYINIDALSAIPDLTTIYLCSLFKLQKNNFAYLSESQKEGFLAFVENDVDRNQRLCKPIKIFQLNKRSYVCSDLLMAMSHSEEDKRAFLEDIIETNITNASTNGTEQPGSVPEIKQEIRQTQIDAMQETRQLEVGSMPTHMRKTQLIQKQNVTAQSVKQQQVVNLISPDPLPSDFINSLTRNNSENTKKHLSIPDFSLYDQMLIIQQHTIGNSVRQLVEKRKSFLQQNDPSAATFNILRRQKKIQLFLQKHASK